jgi:hypothetical protein
VLSRVNRWIAGCRAGIVTETRGSMNGGGDEYDCDCFNVTRGRAVRSCGLRFQPPLQTRPNGTTRLAFRAFADDVCARCFRTSLCRFLRNIFIPELASGVGSVSPSFRSAIKQCASWDCFSEASKTLSIGSNSTNAQAFSNAMLSISVSAESKTP